MQHLVRTKGNDAVPGRRRTIARAFWEDECSNRGWIAGKVMRRLLQGREMRWWESKMQGADAWSVPKKSEVKHPQEQKRGLHAENDSLEGSIHRYYHTQYPLSSSSQTVHKSSSGALQTLPLRLSRTTSFSRVRLPLPRLRSNEGDMVEYLKFIKGSWDNSYILKKLKKSFLEMPKFWAYPNRHKMTF